MGHVKKPVQRKVRPTRAAGAPTLHIGTTQAEEEEENEDDYEDEDDIPWGGFGNQGRHATPHEDSSMKKIKTVQGEEGRWTVTDCDADKKAEK